MEIPYDALVTLILFPVVYTPLTAPREIRNIIIKRWRWVIVITLPFLLSSLLFIGAMWFSANCQQYQSLIWPSVVVILLVIDLIVALWSSSVLNSYDGVIKLLEAEINNTIEKLGKLEKRAIADLLELGVKSDSWQHRDLVLQSINRVVNNICSHQEYRGEDLDAIVLRVIGLLETDNSENLHNFSIPRDMVRTIVFKSKEKGLGVRDDIQDSVRALGSLSQIAMSRSEYRLEKIEEIVFQYVDVLDMTANLQPNSINQVSQVFYEIGVLAITNDLRYIGFVITHKLNGFMGRNLSPDKNTPIAYTLGLIAHLWVDYKSSRDELDKRLQIIATDIDSSLSQAVETSIRHFKNFMRFDTVDNLKQMMNESTTIMNHKA